MTREELKAHCKRQIEQFERIEKIMPVTPNDWKRYEEHKLVLELLEQGDVIDKIRAEVAQKIIKKPWLNFKRGERDRNDAFLEVLDIIDKYKAEQGVSE